MLENLCKLDTSNIMGLQTAKAFYNKMHYELLVNILLLPTIFHEWKRSVSIRFKRNKSNRLNYLNYMVILLTGNLQTHKFKFFMINKNKIE